MNLLMVILALIGLLIIVSWSAYWFGWFAADEVIVEDEELIEPGYIGPTVYVEDTSSVIAGSVIGAVVAEEIIEDETYDDGVIVEDRTTEC